MANNKLGLKIVRYYNGTSNILGVNEHLLWVEHTSDTRSILKSIDNIESATEPILILKNIDGGSLIAIARLIGGRDEDCITAWLYIPDRIRINGKQIADVIANIKTEILASRIDEERLENLFKQEYELLPTKKIIYAARGAKDAFRYYGMGCRFNLNEILEELNQPYYKDYNYIFILDKASGLVCFGDNLTDRSMVSTVLIQPPTPVDGFCPYVDNNTFDSEILVAEGSEIRIVWHRSGYEDITKICRVEKSGLPETSKPVKNEYRVIVPFNIITVTDEKGRRIPEYSLLIDNISVKQGGSVTISYERLSHVRVRIEAENFKVVDSNLDLRHPQTIRLDSKRYSYKLCLDEIGDWCVIRVETERKFRYSPIYGYVKEYTEGNEKNGYTWHLRYRPYTKKLFVIIALWTLAAISIGGYLGYKYSSHQTPKPAPSMVPYQSNKTDDSKTNGYQNHESEEHHNVWDDISGYLDENNVWERTEMNKWPEIDGLWDAINEHRFDDILKFGDELIGSERFMRLTDAIERNKNKQFQENYCPRTDTKITIDKEGANKGYIKALDDANAKKDGSSPAPNTKSKKSGSSNDSIDNM